MRLFVDYLISFKGCEHHEGHEKGEIGLQDFIEIREEILREHCENYIVWTPKQSLPYAPCRFLFGLFRVSGQYFDSAVKATAWYQCLKRSLHKI